MISAEFYLKDEVLIGFRIKGHADYDDFGQDVVCAAVSSAVELTANAITEILKVPAEVGVFENEIRLSLPDCNHKEAIDFLKALRLQLELISQEFPENIQLTDLEV
jgi:uncharacterized protein YsxB (DUF464 family)